MRKCLCGVVWVLVFVFFVGVCWAVGLKEPRRRLRVATTTSLYDTGLWGYLEPMFEARYGVELDVIYAGTGKARVEENIQNYFRNLSTRLQTGH